MTPENGQGMECGVVVEVERIEDAFNVGGSPFFQDVIRQDPGEGHLDGKLDPFAHCHL